MNPKHQNSEEDWITPILLQYKAELKQGLNELAGHDPLGQAKQSLLAKTEELYVPVKPELVDRFEVIDDTGRAYVKGSIYGIPVKVWLSVQDEGRTLKVFVDKRDSEANNG